MTQKPESRRGLIHGATAYGLWGLLPLYFHLLDQVDAGEIVAQRILWSVVLLVPIVLMLGRRKSLWAVLCTPRTMAMLAASAVLIAANWLLYVWAVLHHQVLAASMAYFLNPLLNIAMGVALLGERLTRTQAVAVTLAGAGVAVLAGAVTTVPLLLFAAAARELKLATLGLLQFLAPTMQFLLAITLFGERLDAAKMLSFGLIWAGLAVYVSGSVLSHARRGATA